MPQAAGPADLSPAPASSPELPPSLLTAEHGDGPPAWERRFRAPRVGLPDWAQDAPDRAVVLATAEGVLEAHSWDARTGALTQLTDRREGTAHAVIEPGGARIWWFDDDGGDEYGVWRSQPFGASPGQDVQEMTGLPPAYGAGLAIGRHGLAVVGRGDDGYGTQVHVLQPGRPPRLLYQHTEDAGVGDLDEDGELVALVHSEHGDSRHPAVRVVRVEDASTVRDLWDGPGKGLEPLGFAPLPGDHRLLVQHERHGRNELLVWDVDTGELAELAPELPGEVADAQWYEDAAALLVAVDVDARRRLYRVPLAGLGDCGPAEPIGPADGTVLAATARPDGQVWTAWSSAAVPAAVRDLTGRVVLAPPGPPAPASVPVEDVWVEGPGGRVHALLRRPAGPDGRPLPGPLPLMVDVHGGPTHHDVDAFRAHPAAWVDHGFAVVQVNYRGSTGYGSAWRDALEQRVGHVELEDVVAVRDHLVATGLADPARIVLQGASWGGFLTLLGLGLHPDRWSVGVAGVPVADYVAAYQDEMEGLKAFDRSLFGGSPEQVPERYQDSSPLTYVDAVRVPVLILAGENDPRCPIRQIENYVSALSARGIPHAVYRYDAGHGSMVDDERVAQVAAELGFALRHLAEPR